MHALADERVERGADSQRHVQAVGKVAKGHAHKCIKRPAGEAIVEHGIDHGFLGGLHGFAVTDRWLHVHGDRLGHGEEHEVHADASGKEHGRPGEGIKFRPRVVRSEADIAGIGKGNIEHEDHGDGGGENVEPAKVVADPAGHTGEGFCRGIAAEPGIERHGNNEDARDDKYRPVCLGSRDLIRAYGIAGFGLVAADEGADLVARAALLGLSRGGCERGVFTPFLGVFM